jgi:hypothetical protein
LGSVASIIAGFVVIGGAVAAYRAINRRASDWRTAIDAFRRADGDGEVLDYVKDPRSGVYGPKS